MLSIIVDRVPFPTEERIMGRQLSDEIAEAVMRNVIRNVRVLMPDMNDWEARSELMWASAMAETGEERVTGKPIGRSFL